MKITHATALLHALENHPEQGAGLVALSAETGIEAATLRTYLSSYPEFFSIINGTSKYRINRENEFHGDPRAILHELEQQQMRQHNFFSVVIAVVTLVIGFSMGVLFSALVMPMLGFE